MSRVGKLEQYQSFNRLENCYGRHQQHGISLETWRDPSKPLMLEIGAGTALISLNFSLQNPNWQVLALDRKSDRLYKTARNYQAVANLAFLQTDLLGLPDFLDLTQAVDLLWLAFPDPYLKSRQAKRRLTHPNHLAFYKQLLTSAGIIKFKTDSQFLFNYTYQIIKQDEELVLKHLVTDLEQTGYDNLPDDVATITKYESQFLTQQKPIYYLEISRTP